ncbi:hypothetical protein [uncultured Cohaesibacter sp.]|uniref:hypothetical protein n=1 Tax=uncultured Cohaesibacter sp. TaxID=1002546 RepID=UPI0029C7D29E|nr:hypothetical protein [uncultured Cohaesibacter sp.]
MDNITLSYGNKCYCGDEAYLLACGVPQATIDGTNESDRMKAIKAECQCRIYAEVSAEAQANISLAAALIGAIAEADRTTEQTAMLAATGEMVDWISSMRAAVQTLVADSGADYSLDAAWPECPATVTALAADY